MAALATGLIHLAGVVCFARIQLWENRISNRRCLSQLVASKVQRPSFQMSGPLAFGASQDYSAHLVIVNPKMLWSCEPFRSIPEKIDRLRARLQDDRHRVKAL